MFAKERALTPDAAETLGLGALGWLADDDARLSGFLAATGTAPADLRRLAGEADFLAAVLDFVLSDDASTLACATALGVAPGAVAAARATLPGGATMHWT